MINVVCATFNQSEELIETIESFLSQSLEDKRLIIIDGGSTDGFHELIAPYREDIDYFISEPDKGISDAFNKGIKEAKPGYVYFLGAGDRFVSPDSLKELCKGCDYKKDYLVCGQVRHLDVRSGKVISIAPSEKKFTKRSLLYRMSLPHQGLLTSTDFFQKFGLFRLDCRYAMDYELLLRAYHRFPDVRRVDVVVADWMSGGVGTGRIREVIAEYHKIKKLNTVASPLVLMFINLYTISKYYIKRVINCD